MNNREKAYAPMALLLSVAMAVAFRVQHPETEIEPGSLEVLDCDGVTFRVRYMDTKGEAGVAHILVALVVVVIGVLILVTLLPILSDAISNSTVVGAPLILLGIIPLVIVAAAILWVLSVFEII